jgi:hypothetical protein
MRARPSKNVIDAFYDKYPYVASTVMQQCIVGHCTFARSNLIRTFPSEGRATWIRR